MAICEPFLNPADGDSLALVPADDVQQLSAAKKAELQGTNDTSFRIIEGPTGQKFVVFIDANNQQVGQPQPIPLPQPQTRIMTGIDPLGQPIFQLVDVTPQIQLEQDINAIANILVQNGVFPSFDAALQAATVELTGISAPRATGGGGLTTFQSASLSQDESQLEEEIRQFNDELALLQDQNRIAQEQNDRTFALRQQELIEQIEDRRQRTQLELDRLSQDAFQFSQRLALDYAGLTAQIGIANANSILRQMELSGQISIANANLLARHTELTAEQLQFNARLLFDTQRLGAEVSAGNANRLLQQAALAIDTQQFAAKIGLDFQALAADIGAGNANRLLQHAALTADIQAQNALRRFQAAESVQERRLP